MKKAVVTFKSIGPYSQSRQYDQDQPKRKGESPDARDERLWREHAHVDPRTGRVMIPGIQLAKAIQTMERRRGDKLRGAKTYVDAFASIEAVTDIILPITPAQLACEGFNANTDGRPGGSKRVWRRYPLVPEWRGKVVFMIWNDLVPEALFREVASDAGILVGIGRRRPEKAGPFGRFLVEHVEWTEQASTADFLAHISSAAAE